MATHSSILAWKILWTEETGGLQSMGSQRVGHNCVTEHAHTHTHTHLLLPVAVTLSDDALNTEWIILTTGPWGNTVGSWKPLVTTFSSTDQYVTCLETPYSIPIADSSTLNSRPIALWLLLECSLSDKCIFLTRHIPASFLFHFKKLNSDMYQYKYWYSILFSDDFLL